MPHPPRNTGFRTSYLFQAVDFGGGADLTELIQGPAGKAGRVAGAHLFNISETFVGTTSGGGVAVGDGSDPNAYYDSGLLLLVGSSPAVNTGLWMPDTVASLGIPVDQALTVTFTATVGGSVTGISDVQLEIDWFDRIGYTGQSVAA